MTKIPTSLDNDVARQRISVGIRVALEEMVAGRDYARVEDILRALAKQTEQQGPSAT